MYQYSNTLDQQQRKPPNDLESPQSLRQTQCSFQDNEDQPQNIFVA